LRYNLETKAWSSLAWLAPLAFLALPNCTFHSPGISPGNNVFPGTRPRTSAIFCDIEQPLGRHCATAADLATGIPLGHAAVALARGETGNIGLDFSADALARCGGSPEAVTFRCAFPEGCPVCVKCLEAIGPPPAGHSDANALCAARCEDFFGPVDSQGNIIPDNPPDPSVRQFCEARAHVSTNAPVDDCAGGACTTAGMLRPDYADPRRAGEPAAWQDLVGVTTSGVFSNTLTRTVAGTGNFDAGADSTQLITHGDGYVQFVLSDATTARAAGLSGAAAPDVDATLDTIGFAVRLTPQGDVFLHESGVELVGPNANGSFATYAAGDAIRVSVTDNGDGTASVSYRLVPAACLADSGCLGTLLRTTGPTPYPFRVDASLRTQGATLTDVRLVRIK
jgi:hypothetical protein